MLRSAYGSSNVCRLKILTFRSYKTNKKFLSHAGIESVGAAAIRESRNKLTYGNLWTKEQTLLVKIRACVMISDFLSVSISTSSCTNIELNVASNVVICHSLSCAANWATAIRADVCFAEFNESVFLFCFRLNSLSLMHKIRCNYTASGREGGQGRRPGGDTGASPVLPPANHGGLFYAPLFRNRLGRFCPDAPRLNPLSRVT